MCLRCIICVSVKVAVSLSCQQVIRQYFILCNPRPSENQFTESCIKEKCFSQTNVCVNPVNHPDVHTTVKQKHKYALIAADICVQVLDSRFQFLLILSKYSWSNQRCLKKRRVRGKKESSSLLGQPVPCYLRAVIREGFVLLLFISIPAVASLPPLRCQGVS